MTARETDEQILDWFYYCFLGAYCPGHCSPDEDCEAELIYTAVSPAPTAAKDGTIGPLCRDMGDQS